MMDGYRETSSGLLIRREDSPYNSVDPENPAMEHWYPSSASVDEAMLPYISTLRDQSRDLERNEGIAAGAIANLTQNVVSDGLRPQSRIDHEYLGLTEEEADRFERNAERVYNMVAGSRNVDLARQLNIPLMTETAFRSVLIEGDCLLVRRYKKRRGHPIGFCLQILEGSRVETPPDKFGEDHIKDGVEHNGDGEAVAYFVKNKSDDGDVKYTRIPAYDKADKPLAILLAHKKYLGQTRGVPYLTPVIEKFKQLNRYTEAEIEAAVLSGMFAIFIKSGGGSGHLNAGIKPKKLPKINLSKGIIHKLLPNEEIQSTSPGRPNSAFEPFVEAIIKQIGVALSLPYEVLTQHFQSSYSAARAALLEAWRFYKIKRQWLITQMCEPIYEWIFSEAVDVGYIDAPGFQNSFFAQKAWLKTEWVGAVREEIDPLKAEKANTEALKNGTASRHDICVAKGKDFEQVAKKLDKEQKMLKITENIDSKNTTTSKNMV